MPFTFHTNAVAKVQIKNEKQKKKDHWRPLIYVKPYSTHTVFIFHKLYFTSTIRPHTSDIFQVCMP